jgi:hypothetical protein
MRATTTLISSLTLHVVWSAHSHEAQSLHFKHHPALRIVGGSIEDPQTSTGDDGNVSPKTTTTDSKPAFVRSAMYGSRTKSGVRDSIKDRLFQMKLPKLNIGLESEAMDKFKTQSSRVLTALGPAAVSFAQLFYQRDGLLTKPAIYALALLGSSCGFHLFLYFITFGYACGVTLPVLAAMILYNVSESERNKSTL